VTKTYDTTIDALAVYRITRLLIEDEITTDLRNAWFERHDPSTTKLGYLATCPWCMGFWVAAVAVAARHYAPRMWSPVARTMALSAAAGILHTRTKSF